MLGREFFTAKWAHSGPLCTVSSQRGTEVAVCSAQLWGHGDRQAEMMGAMEGGIGRGSLAKAVGISRGEREA